MGTRATGGGWRIQRRLEGELSVSDGLLLYCEGFEPDLVHSGACTGRYDGGCCGVMLTLKVLWPSPPVPTMSVVVAVVVAGEKEKCGGPGGVRFKGKADADGGAMAAGPLLPACLDTPPTLPPDQRSSAAARSS